MGESEKILVPEDLPQHFHRAFLENFDIISDLFSSTDKTKSTEIGKHELPNIVKISEDLLHFLQVITDVFYFSSKSSLGDNLFVAAKDSPILQRCLQRFHEGFRQGFRGVKYLASGKLSDVADSAEVGALKLLYIFYEECGMISHTDGKEAALLKLLCTERNWIYLVNEHRRKMDVDIITFEAVSKFQDSVSKEFKDISESGVTSVYYEQDVIQTKLDQMVVTARDEFKGQIPFEEDNLVLENLCDDFVSKLETKVTGEVLRKNAVQRQVVQARMDVSVEHAVELYTENMANFVTEIVHFDKDEVLERHEKVKCEVMPMFVDGGDRHPIEIGTHEYQVQCWNRFNKESYASFVKLIQQLSKSEEEKLNTCEIKVSENMQNGFKLIDETLKKYNLESLSTDLQTQLHFHMKQMLVNVKEQNAAAALLLIEQVKPIKLLTDQEKLQLESSHKSDSQQVCVNIETVESGTNTDFIINKRMRFCNMISRFWFNIKFYYYSCTG